ncbi:MAG: WYL domain-containing protein [Planctomycetota bacterium]
MYAQRIGRLLRLIVLLQSGPPRNAKELCDVLGVSRRTLFRDLNQLEAAGIPYFHERGAGYRIGEHFFLPPVSLTVAESLGLMLLGRIGAAQLDKPLAPQAMSAIAKIAAHVPEPIRSACADLVRSVNVRPAPQAAGEHEREPFVALQQAIDKKTTVRIDYQSPVEEKPTRLDVDPYLLHFSTRAWYLLGHSHTHDEVRVLKLVRMAKVEPTAQRFSPPATFRAQDKLGDAWEILPEGQAYDVELRFDPIVATNVSEVRWHPSQQHEIEADGACRVRFRVDGLREIAWWLCGYAGQVDVVKPKKLRALVARMHRDALERLG